MNFALILMVLVVLTGIAWVAEKVLFLPGRRRAAVAAVNEFDRQQTAIGPRFATPDAPAERARLHDEKLRQPWWLEYSASFFPVILLVFVLRSFVIEPFKIPSGSMVPTLLVGDFILVNKFEYGLRMPVFNNRLTPGADPKRGDVIVFRYPKDESVDYIKRVIGQPGDTISYHDKQLLINGQAVAEAALPDFFDEEAVSYAKQFRETIDGRSNNILNNPAVPPYIVGADDYPFRQNCTYDSTGITCKVPAGHYFVMGDNRDNSADSRYWGFVPEQNIVGRAFFIWLNFSNLKRIGPFG